MNKATSLALLLMLAACSKAPTSEPTPPAPAPEAAGSEPGAESASGGRRMFIECPAESRGAEMCTMDYSPVCGQHADEAPAKTYGNVCAACKDANVKGYFTGECETGANE